MGCWGQQRCYPRTGPDYSPGVWVLACLSCRFTILRRSPRQAAEASRFQSMAHHWMPEEVA